MTVPVDDHPKQQEIRGMSSSESTYEICLKSLAVDGNEEAPSTDALLQCITTTFDAQISNTSNSVDAFFLLYAASLVFFMQAGFAMLCAGCVRINNVQNTLLKNMLDACGASLGFYTVGYAFAFGGSFDDVSTKTFIGSENFFLMGVENDSFWLFQFAFCATSATIVAGTLAERCQMTAVSYPCPVTANFSAQENAQWYNVSPVPCLLHNAFCVCIPCRGSQYLE